MRLSPNDLSSFVRLPCEHPIGFDGRESSGELSQFERLVLNQPLELLAHRARPDVPMG